MTAASVGSDADRRFFRRHPDRRHRLRLASRDEVRAGTGLPYTPNWRAYVLVKHVNGHVRIRQFISLLWDFDTDLSENDCRDLWLACATPERNEIEQRIIMACSADHMASA